MKKILFIFAIIGIAITGGKTMQMPDTQSITPTFVTICIFSPNPENKDMKPLTITDDELIKKLKEIDKGSHQVSNINKIPLNFYDSILKLASTELAKENFEGDFIRTLISLWGIGNISPILEKKKNIPLIIETICRNLKEVKEKLKIAETTEGEQ